MTLAEPLGFSMLALLIAHVTSTHDDQWGWGPPHCFCHFNSMTNGGMGILLLIAPVTSTLNS